MERGEYGAASMDYSKIQELDPSTDMRQKIKDAQKKERSPKRKTTTERLVLLRAAQMLISRRLTAL